MSSPIRLTLYYMCYIREKIYIIRTKHMATHILIMPLETCNVVKHILEKSYY